MIDPQTLRRDLQGVADRLRRRGFDLDVAGFERLEARRRSAQDETERLRHERRTSSKRIGAAKAAGEDIEPLVRAVGDLGDRLTVVAREFDAVREQLDEFVLAIPNPPHDTVPAGTDETDNVELRSWGEIMEFNFEPRDHVQLAAEYLDLESAAKVAGSRFSVLRGPLAKLHRALTQFMIDVHTAEHGYEEVYVPYLVHRSALEGTGQLPKFEADLFAVDGERDRFLIPTAEVPVTNLMRDRILDADDLPLRFVAHTPCFRSEAGNYGKDTHGIFRQHQFEKVELVQIVRPEASWEALDELTAHAETILRRLELPYRAVVLCAGRPGFRGRQDHRLRGLAPRGTPLPGDLVLQQLSGLPGTAHARPLPKSRHRQTGFRAHDQRVGTGGGPDADRAPGELPGRRRRDPHSRCAAVRTWEAWTASRSKPPERAHPWTRCRSRSSSPDNPASWSAPARWPGAS